MTESASGGEHTPDPRPAGATPVPPAPDRASRFTYANMIRSMLPLTVIILALVGFAALRQNDVDPVRPVESGPTIQLAARTAGHPLLVPTGLPDGWVTTSARTNAGGISPGDPVTLELGWYTPAEEYAAYVSSDNPRSDVVTGALDGAREESSEEIAGETWTRSVNQRNETVLTRVADDSTLVVTGSAPDSELETLAASLQPYTAT
jgi:hypothetical protein